MQNSVRDLFWIFTSLVSSVGNSLKKIRPRPGRQLALHPHPLVTAVAKPRNRRAACSLPLRGRGALESCARSFDFVRVAHFAQADSKRGSGRQERDHFYDQLLTQDSSVASITLRVIGYSQRP